MHGELLSTAGTDTLATSLQQRIAPLRDALAAEWQRHPIAHFMVDDLLPPASAHALSESFPNETRLQRARSLCESAYVTRGQRLQGEPLDQLLHALQAPATVQLLSDITGVQELAPDHDLAFSGLLSLGRAGFQNPHLEASHHPRGDRYCVLKGIYYLTPDWRLADGGQLELWEDGLSGLPTVSLAKWNRLSVIAMHDHSWHSINRVHARRPRRALVHAYFAPEPLAAHGYRHKRCFRGRPDQSLRDLVLRCVQSGLPPEASAPARQRDPLRS